MYNNDKPEYTIRVFQSDEKLSPTVMAQLKNECDKIVIGRNRDFVIFDVIK